MVIKVNKEWLKSLKMKGFEKWFQRDNLIILVLAGILLFIIALPVEENTSGEHLTEVKKTGTNSYGNGSSESGSEKSPVADVGSLPSGSELEYVSYLEGRLEKMLCGVDGVGKVSVMITLEASEELVLEKDTPVTRSSVEEKDGEGGSRITTQSEMLETTIYSTEGSDSQPYVIKRILPKVEGVLVVAQGAGSGTVNKSITEIVQALFDVDAHKIKVVAMDAP